MEFLFAWAINRRSSSSKILGYLKAICRHVFHIKPYAYLHSFRGQLINIAYFLIKAFLARPYVPDTLEDFIKIIRTDVHQYGSPNVFNTDQGTQFTSQEFIRILTGNNISISMDGRGRCLDNIFVERLWRSVKYENVYLKGYQTIPEARAGLAEYFGFYNKERYHQSLDNKTPWIVYCQGSVESQNGRLSTAEAFHLN